MVTALPGVSSRLNSRFLPAVVGMTSDSGTALMDTSRSCSSSRVSVKCSCVSLLRHSYFTVS